MKALCDATDLNKLKNVTLSIDVTGEQITVVISKIHFSRIPNSQRTLSQIQVISVNTTEVKETTNEHNPLDPYKVG